MLRKDYTLGLSSSRVVDTDLDSGPNVGHPSRVQTNGRLLPTDGIGLREDARKRVEVDLLFEYLDIDGLYYSGGEERLVFRRSDHRLEGLLDRPPDRSLGLRHIFG